MQNQPQINTAIPKGRYKLGDYAATLLGDIESRDARQYRYILAFVPDGQREPKLYVCSEPVADPAQPRLCNLRLVSDTLTEVLDTSERWADADEFARQALEVGAQALGLQAQQAIKLL
jgi:hypothetical protein